MPGVEIAHIDSLDDPRLEAYTKLTERQLRSVLEPEKGIFIAESGKVIERAVEAGLVPVSFLLGCLLYTSCPSRVDRLIWS